MSVDLVKPRELYSILDPRFPPSVERLPAAMTVNSITEYPDYRYYGFDANGVDWKPRGYGEILTLQAGAAPTYNDGSPLLGPSHMDDSVLMNGGGYYQAGNNTFADITTEDFVWELIFRYSSTNFATPFGKFSATGYILTCLNTTQMRAYVYDGVATQVGLTGYVEGHIYHVLLFFDRDAGMRTYVNGIQGTGGDITPSQGSLTSATPFLLGYSSGGVNVFDQHLFYVAGYKRAAWMNSQYQPALAAERFYALSGVYPPQADGTAAPDFSRASPGYLSKLEDDGTTKIYYMGAGWPRVEKKLDANGETCLVLLNEAERTNIILESNVPHNWIPNGGTVALSTAVPAPDGVSSVTKFSGLNASVYQAFNGTASELLSLDIWFYKITAAGSVTFYNSTGLANGHWTVSLAGVPVGTWVRLNHDSSYVTVVEEFEQVGASHLVVIAAASEEFYMWNTNVLEGDNTTITSPIITDGTPITRLADSLSIVGNDGNIGTIRGRMTFDLVVEDLTNTTNLNVFHFKNAGTDSWSAYIDTSGQLILVTVVGGVTTWTGTLAHDFRTNKKARVEITQYPLISSIVASYYEDPSTEYSDTGAPTAVMGSVFVDLVAGGNDGGTLNSDFAQISNLKIWDH